jgi:competence protein ComGE
MLQKSDGYFLTEMLLSMAAFIMAAAILLPYTVMVQSQTMQLREDTEALHLLYDELMYIKIAGAKSGRGSFFKNGVLYNVTVDDSSPLWEVCVHYAAKNQKNNTRCAFME